MEEFDKIIRTLEHGGTILYPTDTIWGIGCDATNAAAVDNIYHIKKRPKNKPFILLVDGIEMLKQYVRSLHPRLETLLAYHMRPLTIIYDQGKNLPPNIPGPEGSVAIRITQDIFCQNIITALGKPLVATSANFSEDPFPEHFGSISTELLRSVDYIVKYKQDLKNMHDPSPIVRLGEKEELIFIRS